MDPLIPELTQLQQHYQSASLALRTAQEDPQNQAKITLPVEPLIEGMNQFLTLATRYQDKPQVQEDAAELGDYGIQLARDLVLLAARLGLRQAQHDLEVLTLSITAWILHHKAELRTLEPIVDALANYANLLREPQDLLRLVSLVDSIVLGTQRAIKQDLEPADPGRPWRILLWNRGIIATRSHDCAAIERVYDEFVLYLPHEAGDFFRKAMQQMQALNYPPAVKTLVQRYYDRFTRQSMH